MCYEKIWDLILGLDIAQRHFKLSQCKELTIRSALLYCNTDKCSAITVKNNGAEQTEDTGKLLPFLLSLYIKKLFQHLRVDQS